jgi:hypothetical protein
MESSVRNKNVTFDHIVHRHFVAQKGSVGKRPHAPSGLIYHQYTGRDAGV